MAKLLAPLAMSLTAFGLSACLYVPPVWDANDPIQFTKDIKVGQTTREQVLKRLGKPVDQDLSSPSLSYYGSVDSGGIILCGAGGGAGGCFGGKIAEKPWEMRIYFDQSNIVRQVCAGTGWEEINALSECRARAVRAQAGQEG